MSVFYPSQRRVVVEALPHGHRDAFGAVWHLADGSLVSAVECVSRYAHTKDACTAATDIQILRQRRHKQVVRVTTGDAESRSWVAKIFRLASLRRRFRNHVIGYNRFGLGEAANLIVAARRGLTVPRVYGYGYARGPSHLIHMNMIVLEDLAPRVSVSELLKRSAKDQTKCADILMRTIPVLAGLFRAGCSHIDVNLEAILLEAEGSQQAFLLDFEHARFSDRASLEVLAFEAGYFARCCRHWLEREAIDRWFCRLLETVGVTDDMMTRAAVKRFDHYLNVSLSRGERRKIR